MVRRGPGRSANGHSREYNKTLLGLIALVVVAVIVATMLLFKAIASGYRQLHGPIRSGRRRR